MLGRREPISEQTRAAVLADIKAGKACRAIAREHGVSPAYVSKLAREVPGDSFDRSRTQQAAAAKAFDAKAARKAAIEELYGDFEKFRSRAWGEYTQVIVGPQGPELVTTKQPPIRDQQAAFTAAAICLDKALVLERHDDTQGAEAGKTMINDLFGALGMAYHRIIAEEQQIDPGTGKERSQADLDADKAAAVKQAEADTVGGH